VDPGCICSLEQGAEGLVGGGSEATGVGGAEGCDEGRTAVLKAPVGLRGLRERGCVLFEESVSLGVLSGDSQAGVKKGS